MNPRKKILWIKFSGKLSSRKKINQYKYLPYIPRFVLIFYTFVQVYRAIQHRTVSHSPKLKRSFWLKKKNSSSNSSMSKDLTSLFQNFDHRLQFTPMHLIKNTSGFLPNLGNFVPYIE